MVGVGQELIGNIRGRVVQVLGYTHPRSALRDQPRGIGLQPFSRRRFPLYMAGGEAISPS